MPQLLEQHFLVAFGEPGDYVVLKLNKLPEPGLTRISVYYTMVERQVGTKTYGRIVGKKILILTRLLAESGSHYEAQFHCRYQVLGAARKNNKKKLRRAGFFDS